MCGEQYRDMSRIKRRAEEKRDSEKTQCLFFMLNFSVSYFSLSSSFSSVSPTNYSLWHKPSNQKVSTTVKMDIFFLSLSPSFLLYPFTLFIPHWLTCFTSPAVISTAFTELINGAEGWVLLNWDNFFSLSPAHMDNYIMKRRKWCKQRQQVERGRRKIRFQRNTRKKDIKLVKHTTWQSIKSSMMLQ